MYTFVTGGARSGRSNYALRRASELGPPPWLYVASGLESGDAIRKRIERHRKDKEAIWRTSTMSTDLRALLTGGALEGLGAVVLDGFAAWLQARLEAADESFDSQLLDEVGDLADRLYRSPVPIVMVSTEMGLGPPSRVPSEQRLIKICSSANQMLATQAGTVVMMVSGVPLRVR